MYYDKNGYLGNILIRKTTENILFLFIFVHLSISRIIGVSV